MSTIEAQQDDMFMGLMTAFIAQIDSSMKISKKVMEHSKTDCMKPDHVIMGLVYRLMNPMTQEEINQSLMVANEILNDESSSEEDEINIEEDDFSLESFQTVRPVERLTCYCSFCKKVNQCLDEYEDFIPTDNLAMKFKESIQKACDVHKLSL
jgi:hypothetical protein